VADQAQIDGPTEVGVKFKWKAGGLNIISQFHTVNANSEIGWTGRIWWIKAERTIPGTRERQVSLRTGIQNNY
jgi:hypothetical protein